MRITNRDKSNLARFGCAFLPKEKLICINWGNDRKDQALSSDIIAQLIYLECFSGPVLSLVFEISPTKVLPYYCLFPFDLKTETNRTYLSDISKKGEIQLKFLAASHQIARAYTIPPRRCKKILEMCSTAIADFDSFPAEQYDFDRAVSELEQRIRVVDYFLYAISETELEREVVSSRAQAENILPEQREQAAKIASDLLGTFRSRYESLRRGHIQQLPFYSRNLLLLADLHNHFEGNYAGAVQFVADFIATHTSKEDNPRLEAVTELLELVFRVIDVLQKPSGGDEQAAAAREMELWEMVGRIATQGLSLEAVKSIFSIFGYQGGRPGRPAKDYSTEYKLRAGGKKWREVAAYNFLNDPEIRQEFGGRNFAELSSSERAPLEHRIREGLRSYAKRTGKPFPPS